MVDSFSSPHNFLQPISSYYYKVVIYKDFVFDNLFSKTLKKQKITICSMEEANVFDFDGTICRKTKTNLIEKFIEDYYKKQNLKNKFSMLLKITAIKLYKEASKTIGKIFDKHDITGETTSLEIFEVLLLKDLKIPMDFVYEKAKEYKDLIDKKHIEEFKNCQKDIYIVSAEPIQLLEAIVDELGLNEKIKKIYGTSFKVNNGVIEGFERTQLFAGVRGKYLGMKEIVSNGYSKIHAIGDSMADIGLFEEHESKIIPYTFENSPELLKEYVIEHGGKVLNNLEEFFENQ